MGRTKESRRSRSKERGGRKKERDSKNSSSSKFCKKRKKEDNDIEGGHSPKSPTPPSANQIQEQTGDISLSVDESNKLRIKLGLAPLEEKGSSIRESETGDPREKIVTEDGNEFVHRVPDNWGDKKKAEGLREKLQSIKDKRMIKQKMLNIKGLADEDQEISAADWVLKNRKLEEEKEMAKKRAKMLEEMDEEFGVGQIVEKELGKRPSLKKGKYDTKALKGLTVQHSKQAFVEGQETVLVLKDKEVLDADDEEVLINPSLIEGEMWKNNAEMRKKKTGYNPYDEGEDIDQFGEPKPKGMLGKYDEELDGIHKESFKLEGTDIDASAETRLAEIKAKLKAAGQQSLQAEPYKIASEYYTNEEMARFKKPKKRVKTMRKKAKNLKVDQLMPLPTDKSDLGSRSKPRGKGAMKNAFDDDTKMDVDETETTSHVKGGGKASCDKGLPSLDVHSSEDSDNSDLDNDLVGFTVEDDAMDELQYMLDKTRKIKQKQPDEEAQRVNEVIGGMKEEVGEAVDNDMTLDATSEYCRGLGELPTFAMPGPRKQETIDAVPGTSNDTQPKKSKKRRRSKVEDLPEDEFGLMIKEHRESKGKWVQAEFEHKKKEKRKSRDIGSSDSEYSTDEEGGPALGNEISAGGGVATALKLFKEKGYIDDEDDSLKNQISVKGKAMECQKYTIVDKMFHDIDDKYTKKLERMGGGGGPVRNFEEKSAYKPAFRLTYRDEHGREMNVKEAFRFQSWKFHGKGPGKKKIEHHERKFTERALMNSMNASDTPLGTLGKQLEKQRHTQQPYIVLSGSGSRDSGALKKD